MILENRPGQSVRKTESGFTESWLKVRQAAIMLLAGLWALAWLAVALLVIGEVLITLAGLALLWALLAWVWRMPWRAFGFHPTIARLGYTFVTLLAAAAWIYLGDGVRKALWPPVRFADGYLWINDLMLYKAPLWGRLGALAGALMAAAAGGILAVAMGIEVFDSNWPPTYAPRDPSEGPWLPGKERRRDPEPVEAEVLPLGLTFWVPSDDEALDLEALNRYAITDEKKQRRARR